MRYFWIEDINEFRNIAEKWDKAVLSLDDDNPFLLSDFIISWWNYYSKDLKLMVFVMLDDDKIIGGVPLCKDKRGRAEYIGGWAANYTEFLSSDNNDILWMYFLEAIKKKDNWSSVSLKRYRKNHSELKINNINGFLIDEMKSDRGYFIDIPDNFSTYLNSLPKTLRYYIRRSEKEFSNIGEINLASYKTCEEVDKLADKFINFSRKSFKVRNRKSAFEDLNYCRFFNKLIEKFCKAGYLDANALKIGDKVVAIHFGYTIRNNLNYIFPAFDSDFSALNPGHLLIYKLVELASKRKNKMFNLYTGYQFYKEQWSNRKEEIISLVIRPKTFMAHIERRATNVVNSSFKSIKSFIKNADFYNRTLRKIIKR